MSEQKSTFNITYYPAFQNVRIIMEELHIFLTPNKDLKKVFPNVLFRTTLLRLNESWTCEPCGEKNFFGLQFDKYCYNLYRRSLSGNSENLECFTEL